MLSSVFTLETAKYPFTAQSLGGITEAGGGETPAQTAEWVRRAGFSLDSDA